MSVGKSSDSVVGSELAGYQIEALIGRGGMGAVYRAHDIELGRTVAIKVLAPELASSERFRERFLRESRLAASLDHPHIVPIFKAGEEEGVLYLAMRYVEGTDLAKLVEAEGTLEPARALALLEQVASALDAAHERGLVHRDVKPSNVLISRAAGKEDCYLADFGLTKRSGSISGLTDPGQVVGTLDYIAPEQIKAEEVDARADLYSLACVLYECLAGSPPFERATDVAVLWGHVHEEASALSTRRPDLPRTLDDVLNRALAKEPDRRFATCRELIDAARAALAPGAVTPRRRYARTLVAGLAALALGAGIAVGVLALRSGSSGLAAVSPNAVGVIDPKKDKLVAEVPVGIAPAAAAVGEGAVWVANVDDETISRIDPQTRQVARTIAVDDFPSDVAVGAGSVWVALGALAEVMRINPDQNQAARPIPALGEGVSCGAPGANVVVGRGAVWFACEVADLGRIDPRTGTSVRVGLKAGLLTSPSSVLPEFSDIAFGLDSLWIVNRAANSIIEVDPVTSQKLREITVGQAPAAIAVGPDSLWVANFEDDTMSRIEVAGRGQAPIVETITVGDGPVDVAFGEGGVWVANSLGGTVSRIDPETSEVVATIKVGNEPRRLAVGEGAVWVTLRAPEE